MEKETKALIDIGKLVFQFARTDRVTLHEDGETLESDTDHTVMLSICACALAERLYPRLDIGKIAQFAIVHDLVEAYAGDTNTFNISKEDRAKKEEREHEALIRIKKEFDDIYPWIARTISEYESLASEEAQFIKMLDKVMTKLTHRMNVGAFLKKKGATKEQIIMQFGNQTRELNEKYGEKFPEMIIILKSLTQQILEETYA